jgi:L-histidine N-alpha-methyltransferase
MLDDVRRGLSLPQKELPPTYFYDERGSRLFDEITRLPEYYLTRAEHDLLNARADELVRLARPASLAELGPGMAGKSRVLIQAILRARGDVVYIPIDVSAATLEATAHALEAEYRGLRVVPVSADIRGDVMLPEDIPRPLLYALLGSTIGNFTPLEAVALLQRMKSALRPGDRLLLGVDLVKDSAPLEAAYNDEAGVTAAFNVNVLHVLNHALETDFDAAAFRHQAYYNAQLRRIEMHLVSLRTQTIRLPDGTEFEFAEGETIRTEISCKYDWEMVEDLFHDAGLRLERWIPDDRDWFALAVGAPAA